MKTKTTVFLCGLILALCIMIPVTGFAQPFESIGVVNEVAQGPQGNVVVNITTTTPALTRNYFVSNANQYKKEMLAIALTSLSTGKQARITFDVNFNITRIAVVN